MPTMSTPCVRRVFAPASKSRAELDLRHADCPCFLLNVAPQLPPLYVELFRDEQLLDDTDGAPLSDREMPLCVVMNWMGSDTEPAFYQIDTLFPEPDFGGVIDRILLLTASF